LKSAYSKLECFRLLGAGNNPFHKSMVWNLQAKVLIILLVIVTLPSHVVAESVDSKIQDGVTQYHDGKFKEAGESFSSARLDRPEDSRLSYNQGNSQYKEGKFEEALKAYTHSSLSEQNPLIKKNSLFNTGNTLVKLGKLEAAETAYKKVLSLDSNDMDAKYNLEYVRQQLKKEEEQKKDSGQDKQESENQDSSQDKKQNENEEQNEDDNQQEENPDSPPESADSQENEPKESGQTEEPAQEAELSEEEAERMLKGLTEDLKSISRMQAGKTKSAYQGNDW
jgi:Ca-activated chloride channel homolog